MSIAGARGLVRIAGNLGCELQAAMVADRASETELYRDLTGEKYPREYGERLSARRRGVKFEANLYQNDAALLRHAVAPIAKIDPEVIWVRNFLDEVPGEKNDRRAVRASRFRSILRDLVAGRRVPELVIQPAFVLTLTGEATDVRFVSPDFLVFDPETGMYVPGEIKSFIVRDVGPNSEDLAPTRLQAAVEIMGLRQEAARVGLADLVRDLAAFVFATPYGLKPTSAIVESLFAEIAMVARAAAQLKRVASRLATMRVADQALLPDLVPELGTNFKESCVSSCALADICRKYHAGQSTLLGDAAVELFGPDADLERLAQLALGAPPNEAETDIALALRDAAAALGLGSYFEERRTA